jgi:head-tail adaptor
MKAGQLDRRVELQSFALGTDGDPTAGTWTVEAAVWAERMDGKGTERARGNMVQASEATQAYRIRYRASVLPTWRLRDGAQLWNIVAASEGRGRDDETILLVDRLDPNDGAS